MNFLFMRGVYIGGKKEGNRLEFFFLFPIAANQFNLIILLRAVGWEGYSPRCHDIQSETNFEFLISNKPD